MWNMIQRVFHGVYLAIIFKATMVWIRQWIYYFILTPVGLLFQCWLIQVWSHIYWTFIWLWKTMNDYFCFDFIQWQSWIQDCVRGKKNLQEKCVVGLVFYTCIYCTYYFRHFHQLLSWSYLCFRSQLSGLCNCD